MIAITLQTYFLETGERFVAVTTALLVIDKPSRAIFDRVAKYFGESRNIKGDEYFDMDIVNGEFACSDEILVLPKVYATLDGEFKSGSGYNILFVQMLVLEIRLICIAF